MDIQESSKESTKKFIFIVMFFLFIFMIGYIVFWSKDLYVESKGITNDNIRQVKDCTGFSFDSRNIYYVDDTLTFDFYLLGFSEEAVNAITVISDRYYENNTNSFAKDFIFKPDIKPGEIKPVKVNFDINKEFHVMIYNCPITDTVFGIN